MVTGVLVDANVLYSRTLRDWLFLLRNETAAGMFTVYASEDILTETLYHYRRNNPKIAGGAIARLRERLAGQLDDLSATSRSRTTSRAGISTTPMSTPLPWPVARQSC